MDEKHAAWYGFGREGSISAAIGAGIGRHGRPGTALARPEYRGYALVQLGDGRAGGRGSAATLITNITLHYVEHVLEKISADGAGKKL
jgi:hypothetical protein